MAYSQLSSVEAAIPTPTTTKITTTRPHQRPSSLQTASYMVIWIISSNCTILFNKWLIGTAGFPYPILLTCWHLVFAAIVTQILAHTTTLLDSRHSLPISRRFYLRTILPIGLVSSGSLVCSNFVYLYLSVAFIQMLKAFSPVIVLFVSWVWGVVEPSSGQIVNIMVIVLGVITASFGEMNLSWIGLAFQLSGLAFEAIRVVMIQVMLSSEGLNMDPLVGLFYYAPVCAALNLLIATFVEIPIVSWENVQKIGCIIFSFNAMLAFLVNFVSLVVIRKTSGLVTTLTGIFKNIILVFFSVLIWQLHISNIQLLGYSITLLGLVYYSFGHQKLAAAYHAAIAGLPGFWK